MTRRAWPVAIFQRVAARDSWISGWGERFSKGRTSWAGGGGCLGGEGSGEFGGAEDGGVEGLGGLVVGDDDDGGGVGGADEEGKVEGAGSGGESGHTSAARASAQVAAYTLKGLGVLQVCEELADEWKDHAELILVEVQFQHLNDGRSNILLPQESSPAFAARCWGRCDFGQEFLAEGGL